ncbi:MAG: hypothetical protein IT305_27610 [Chloroflexi bacterium]|nr:hypothetical protein [Chloroflexota bacterium]
MPVHLTAMLPLLRATLAAALLASVTLVAPGVALAAPQSAGSSAAPIHKPAADDYGTYLSRLLDEINARRAAVGTQSLHFVPQAANAALGQFLDLTSPSLAWPMPCAHQFVGNEFSWDYVAASGYEGQALGEVLACPGPEPYWTPARAAESWWESPYHFDVLYADGAATEIACSANGFQRGKRDTAATAVLCVLYRE